MKKLLIAMAAVVVLLNFSACKKEPKETTCQINSFSTGAVTFSYQYDASGNLTRLSLPSGSYLLYTYNGNEMTQQGYNSSGLPSGSPRTTQLNSRGDIIQMINTFDTTFYSYNADGRLVLVKIGINATGGRTELNYNQKGDVTQMINYASDSSITKISTYQMYEDKPNNTTFNELVSGEVSLMPFARLGKPSAHFFKQVLSSQGGNSETVNFYWEFDANNNPTRFSVLSQPGNDVYEFYITSLCTE